MPNKKWIWIGKLIGAFIITTMLLITSGCTQTSTESSHTTQGTKILKIGVVSWTGYPVGFNMVRTVQVAADAVNAKGGLIIGNDRYTIQLIQYDSQNTQATEVSAVNRLVFEDKVSFIISEANYAAGWLSVTEPNKVIVLASNPNPALHDPQYKYVFSPTFTNSSPAVTIGWFVKNYPEKKSFISATEDTQTGHLVAMITDPFFAAYNLQKEDLFYPQNATDISSIGTRVMQMNPDVFIDCGAGAIGYKAVVQAGYTGQLFSLMTRTTLDLKNYLSDSDLEGFIGGAYPTEFTPPATTESAEFFANYIAKYGEWDDPQLEGAVMFSCLKTAIQQAGSLDTDKIASIIGNGLEYETPAGRAKMLARQDMGNTRTTDGICTTYIKEIKEGQPTLVTTIDIDEGRSYYDQIYKVSEPTTTQAPPPEGTVIPWNQAKNLSNWGDTVIVSGVVDSAMSVMPPETVVLLGGPIGTGFMIIIPDPSPFPEGLIDSYVGATIEVTGELNKFLTGDASIIVADPSQIMIK
ncbi:MAG: ABC transporter substrate-binding protein [Dehalococcoidales bacterium]|nr:ABC transporter substrate-binding protein [Dehalococcoidales bacterium]